MPGRLARPRSLVVLLALAALLALPSGATAKPRVRHEPANQWIRFEVPGAKGWSVFVEALVGKAFKPPKVEIDSGKQHVQVSYRVRGHTTADGTISAKFPGVGRIEVEFQKTEEKKGSFGAEGCTNDRPPVELKGTFRGVIDLNGKGSFGRVNRRSATGTILEAPPQTCPVHKHRSKSSAGEETSGEGFQFLEATDGPPKDFLGFDVFAFPKLFPGLKTSGDFRDIGFNMTSVRKRHGMESKISVGVTGERKQFTVSAPDGTPTEAVVEPPAPFTGSAQFKLESPTESSWTGDLAIDLPVLGEVQLTGPSFSSILCEASICTPTAAQAVHVRPTHTIGG